MNEYCTNNRFIWYLEDRTRLVPRNIQTRRIVESIEYIEEIDKYRLLNSGIYDKHPREFKNG
jgi:hypothetical protein